MSVTATQQFKDKAAAFSAEQILAIPDTEPERLFQKADQSVVTAVFRSLASKWHPDHSNAEGAEDVFNHVAMLRKAANDKLENGKWETPGELLITDLAGKTVKIRYLKKHDFELGQFYISDSLVTYVIEKGYKDLFENGIRRIKNLQYADDNMRETTARLMPEIHKVIETKDAHVVTIRKSKDQILAADLLEYCDGKVDPRHVAWMVSRLHNITSYLQYAGLAHNNIDLSTTFISPEHHSVSLLGGWWYAVLNGEKLKGLPSQSVGSVPRASLERGLADARTDHTLMRVMGRQLLGDRTGVRLARDSEIPKPMTDWLCLPGSGDAFKDYDTWMNKVVLDSFGKRRFRVFDVSPQAIYQPTT